MVACGYPKHGARLLFTVTLLFSRYQHNRHCIALGDELNPHPEMVEIILRPEPGVEKKVLDVGQSPSVIIRQSKLIKSFLLPPVREWEWYMVSTYPSRPVL